jgi:NADPH2:quinone reductase
MSRAFVVREHGGPEQLQLEELEVAAPGPGQLKIRNRAIGLNFVDVYQRTGLYPTPLPFVAGNEGAGEVIAVGPDVQGFKPGDRIAYQGPVGAYADERLLPADRAVHLPDNIPYETAAAALLKGATAFYLLHWTHELKAGESTLIHAAAGGTGQILVQWAKAIGATVVATAGSEEKCDLVRELGADLVVNYKTDDFVARTKEFTQGRGVDVVYDGVGKATFEPSLDCLRVRGLMVSFGNASGPVSMPRLGILADKGSLYVTRPTGAGYFRQPEDLRTAADALFNMIELGKIKIAVAQQRPLAEAADAHRALEARETTGSTVLIP